MVCTTTLRYRMKQRCLDTPHMLCTVLVICHLRKQIAALRRFVDETVVVHRPTCVSYHTLPFGPIEAWSTNWMLQKAALLPSNLRERNDPNPPVEQPSTEGTHMRMTRRGRQGVDDPMHHQPSLAHLPLAPQQDDVLCDGRSGRACGASLPADGDVCGASWPSKPPTSSKRTPSGARSRRLPAEDQGPTALL